MAEREKLAQVKIFRFNPKVDNEPKYEKYRVPYQDKTVLDVLQYILDNQDPTLSFRYGCAGAGYERCVACVVLVNDKPALSCKRMAEENMIIEPHPRFEVIKDLVIDFEREKKVTSKRRVTVEITVDPDKCDGCHDCILICPVKVYEVQKLEGRARAVPINAESCCGSTCMQCALFCKNSAITVNEKILS